MDKKKIVVAVTGASGAIYARTLLDTLLDLQSQWERIALILSDNARQVWEYELKDQKYAEYPFEVYEKKDFFSPVASGSAGFDAMIIAPCSMGTLGRIASGVSDDLITRAADVHLKERKPLVLLVRETPYNVLHLQHMLSVTQAGGIICPASPSFYSHPDSFTALAATVTNRALQLCGLKPQAYRWGEDA